MKKIVVVLALAGAAVGVWRWHRTDAVVETSDAKLVADRIWLDHLPRNERETINVFLLLSEDSVGVYQAASMWKGTYEGFRFELGGEELRLVFPQTGEREKVRVKARRCKEQGMDYCLDLDGGSRGVRRYYSREGWEIGSLDAGRAKLEQIQAAR